MSDATRETAYTVWKACGQNMSKAVKTLSGEHGIDVTRQTLAAWRDNFDWTARAARSEAEAETMATGASDESLMNLLLAQKEKYRTYLERLAPGRVDNQATYALNHIVKTIMDIRKKSDAGTVSTEAISGGELRPITTDAEAVEALREAVELKINRMLAGDGVNLSAVKDLQKALELIETMRARHQAETGEKVKKGGISAEGADQIRARILGIESK